VGLIQRLFGATREAIALPNFDAGSQAVNLAAAILRECIDLGSAGRDGPNRGRLAKAFARGYIYGLSHACIQRLGVFGELESLALITMVHAEIFGRKIGPLLVGDALRDQRNAEFGRGRTAGTEDFLRRLANRSYTSFLLTEYLRADEATAVNTETATISPVSIEIEPQTILYYVRK
jgi:hypothetical protein